MNKEVKIIGTEKIKYDPPFKMWLFVTMRAILDSKYNEHKVLQYSNPRGLEGVTKFSGNQFILTWMQTLCILGWEIFTLT